jgi:uroporphyrinogen decarboxylase
LFNDLLSRRPSRFVYGQVDMIRPIDRIRAALAGTILDVPPLSFWTHIPDIDLDPSAIATATARFSRQLGLDLVKSMPNGLYCVEDWGVKGDFSAIASGGVARSIGSPIQKVEDWRSVRRLDIRGGAYGRELDHLERLVRLLGPEIPTIATVFSPITIAKKLSASAFEQALDRRPDLLRGALAQIAATTADFARSAISLGCAGIFFAIQDATSKFGTSAYSDIGVPFDLEVLHAASGGWCNAVHLHGDDILFDLIADYPVHVLNWHIGETAPTIAEYRARGGNKAVLGGLRRMAVTAGDRSAIAADIALARQADRGRGIIYGPGCVIRHPVDESFLARIIADIRATGAVT